MNLFNIPIEHGHDKEELLLVKSALLYGDEVHLYNPMYSVRERSVRRYVLNYIKILFSAREKRNILDDSASNFDLFGSNEDLDDDFDLLNGYFQKGTPGYYACKFSLESLKLALNSLDDEEDCRNKEFVNRCITYYSAHDKNNSRKRQGQHRLAQRREKGENTIASDKVPCTIG